MRLNTERVLRLACGCALVALALMVWSLLDPRPLPVIAAMSAGQVLGTLSFAVFLLVVVNDLRPLRADRVKGDSSPPAPGDAEGRPSHERGR